MALASGFVGLVLLSAYIHRSQKAVMATSVYLNHQGHLAFLKKDSLSYFQSRPAKYLLQPEEQQVIQNLSLSFAPEIEFHGRYLSGAGLVSNGKNSVPFIALGLEPEALLKAGAHEQVRKYAADWILDDIESLSTQFQKDPSSISMTLSMAELLGLSFPFQQLPESDRSLQLSALSFQGDFNAVNANLVFKHTTGMELADPTSLRVTLSTLQSLFQTEGLQYWAWFLKDPTRTHEIQRQVQALLQQKQWPIEVYAFDSNEWDPYYVGTMDFLYVIAVFFVFLICGAVSLAIVNSTTLGILERLREIGTLRSLGFSPAQIQTLFVRENSILSLIAMLAGLVISCSVVLAINSANIRFHPPGTQGDTQFLLILNFIFVAFFALILLLLTLLTTWLVTRKYTQASVVSLLSDAGG